MANMQEKDHEDKSKAIKKIIPKPAGKEKGIEIMEKGNRNDE